MQSQTFLTLVGIVVPVIMGIVAVLWATGGPTALKRRVIMQEVQIARDMADGQAKDRLQRLTSDRVAVYVADRIPRPSTRRQRVTYLCFSILLFALWFPQALSYGNASPSTPGEWTVFVLPYIGGITSWTQYLWLSTHKAGHSAARVQAAYASIDRYYAERPTAKQIKAANRFRGI